MKISDFRAAQIAQGYGVQKPGSGPASKRGTTGTSASDSAALSAEAKTFVKGRQAAQGAPEVRGELVSELRRAVKDGTYQVDEYALAGKMLAHPDLTG
jgi:flagellar biosynthesis anti-sigma factor FlgM